MGFHKANTVYRHVSGTTATQQAVLAYLALAADDQGNYRLIRSDEQIAAATHLRRSAIARARGALRKAGLLGWKTGGRRPGGGGVAKANEYFLRLPNAKIVEENVENPSATRLQRPNGADGQCPPDTHSSVHDASRAVSATRTQQCPPGGHHQYQSSQSNKQSAECAGRLSEPRKVDFESEAEKWIKSIEAQPVAGGNVEQRTRIAVLEEAYKASGANDGKSREMLVATIGCRDANACIEVIEDFREQMKRGYRPGCPSAVLNVMLAKLPKVRKGRRRTVRA